MKSPIFCRRFVAWTLQSEVHSVLQFYVVITRYIISQSNQCSVIGLVHIWKSGTCGHVFSTKRVLGEKVYVVGDNHHVAHSEVFVGSTCGIADEECLDSQFIHYSDRECYLLHSVSFIVVEPSLHRKHALASELPNDESAIVSLNGRNREMGNILVWHFPCYVYLVSQIAKPGA